jgi:hypothetical protein
MSAVAQQGVSTEAEETPAAGFEIDGERYDIPTLDTVTLDEERIMFLYADCVVQDFAPAHPKWDDNTKTAHDMIQGQKVRNPDFKRALAHIAYRRRHPEMEDSEINAALGKVNALEVDIAMLEGGDASPPDLNSQNELGKQSKTGEPTKSTGSGSPTDSSSEDQAESPGATGTTESGTSSRQSPELELVS